MTVCRQPLFDRPPVQVRDSRANVALLHAGKAQRPDCRPARFANRNESAADLPAAAGGHSSPACHSHNPALGKDRGKHMEAQRIHSRAIHNRMPTAGMRTVAPWDRQLCPGYRRVASGEPLSEASAHEISVWLVFSAPEPVAAVPNHNPTGHSAAWVAARAV